MVHVFNWLARAAGAVLVTWLVMQALQHRTQTQRWDTSQFVSAEQRTQELTCLANNIYWEAATEPFEGKVAVAQVTINRMRSGRFPDTVCAVVHQKNLVYERVICQFSWYCEGHHRVRRPNSTYYAESMKVAQQVLLEGYRLPGLERALYYHADYVHPGWRLPKLMKIGRHVFYGERP